MSKQKKLIDYNNLTVAKGLRVRVANDGNMYASISSSSGEFYIAPEVLAILCLIENKTTKFSLNKTSLQLTQSFQNTLNSLPSQTECQNIIFDLIGAGIVINSEISNEKYMQNDGFGDPWAQWTMISDIVRCEHYFNALQKFISPKSVVLDVGAGSGLLSAISLNLGAKKVFAIEETNSALYIKSIFKKLGLNFNSSKFELHNKNSFDVEINDAVNLIVSELFGNDPFQEGVIITLREIASKLINFNVNYIPKSLTFLMQIIDLHSHSAFHRIQAFQKPDDSNLTNNKFLSNFLNTAKENLDLNNISFSLPLTKNDFSILGKAVELGTIPLNPPPVYSKEKHPLKGKKTLTINKNADNAIAIIWFRVHLTDEITISSLISETDACSHWSPIAIPLNKSLKENDFIEINHYLNDEENHIHCELFYNKEKIGSR